MSGAIRNLAGRIDMLPSLAPPGMENYAREMNKVLHELLTYVALGDGVAALASEDYTQETLDSQMPKMMALAQSQGAAPLRPHSAAIPDSLRRMLAEEDQLVARSKSSKNKR